MDKTSQRAEHSSTFATDDGIHQLAERSASLPAKLYRVQYGGCQTNHDGNGLHANDHSRLPSTLLDFAQSIEDHFTWGNGTASRYITLFSDGVHARNWASSRSRSTGRPHYLITISTSYLSQSKVFKLSNLVISLNLTVPDGASQHIPGAYLCLHCVPSHAIENVIDGNMLGFYLLLEQRWLTLLDRVSSRRITPRMYASGRLLQFVLERLRNQTDIEK